MEPALDDLMLKIKAISQGPNAELLHKLVDVLYEQGDLGSSVRLGFCISVIFLLPKLWGEMVANPGVLLHINT